MANTTRIVKPPQNYESIAWKWMRYSGILLIPLVWIHVLIQDVVIGVHGIVNTPGGAHLYVLDRWGTPLWIVYDILLLAFTFAHGVNGLRQVLNDFIQKEKTKQAVSWLLFAFWLIISIAGGAAIVLAAAKRLANL